ncbi:MAG: hypothetical protein CMC07_04585 [Flavobacteriaceae bacterium]|jgi:hypothetical protein|nr:hypothetical protein [Flavobacteriaceae bacterium]HBY66992.1 hypothetical protein [Flavobacteriaceae bacterium]|tara:strand:+ start:20840 stop:21157 length:318 start_codon:yes stop_codon:yes gene_type:complete
MGFGGSALAMMQTLKNNAKQLAKRKRYFDKNKASYSTYGKFVDHKKMSPEQFATFQKQLKENNANNRRRLLLVFSAVMLLILAVIIYFLYFFEIASAKPIKFQLN